MYMPTTPPPGPTFCNIWVQFWAVFGQFWAVWGRFWVSWAVFGRFSGSRGGSGPCWVSPKK